MDLNNGSMKLSKINFEVQPQILDNYRFKWD